MLYMVQIQKSQLSEKLLFGLRENSKKFDVRDTCIKLFLRFRVENGQLRNILAIVIISSL